MIYQYLDALRRSRGSCGGVAVLGIESEVEKHGKGKESDGHGE